MSDYISEDSLVQLLKWLPVKSLLRFRCVCKWWKDIIDSHSFTQEHLAVQKPRLLVGYEKLEFLVLDPHTLPFVETLSDPITQTETFRLVGTHHGVVCVYDDENCLWIWNPSIRNFLILDLPYDLMESDKWYDYPEIFEFDFACCSSFWIDPSDKSFKVIVLTLAVDKEMEIMGGVVYSSIQQVWSVVPLYKSRNYRPFQEGPPVMIGRLSYWRASYEEIHQGVDYTTVVILSFDFVHERFDVIEVPRMNYLIGHHPIPCNLEGALTLVYRDAEYPPNCDIYSRQEGIWAKTFCFRLFHAIYDVLCALGEMEESCRVLASTGEALVLYDTKDGCTDLKSGLMDPSRIYVAYDFVESLLFPSDPST